MIIYPFWISCYIQIYNTLEYHSRKKLRYTQLKSNFGLLSFFLFSYPCRSLAARSPFTRFSPPCNPRLLPLSFCSNQFFTFSLPLPDCYNTISIPHLVGPLSNQCANLNQKNSTRVSEDLTLCIVPEFIQKIPPPPDHILYDMPPDASPG